MKKVKSLYFIAALFFIIIIISLFISRGITEDFDITLKDRIFKGTFDKTCENCNYDELKKTLTCECLDNSNKKKLTSIKFTEDQLIDLRSTSIINTNGLLSIRN